MQFIVWYEDGEAYSSNEYRWNQLPRDKKIKSIGVFDADDNYYELEGYDEYFFSDEASFSLVTKTFKLESRMLAGFNSSTGEGELVRVFIEGEASTEVVYLDDFKQKFNDDAFIATT